MTTKAYQDFLEKCSNAYLDFIQDCREKAKDYSSEQLGQCQTHHIVPRHHYKNHKLSPETFNLPQNLVELTFEDHVKAHQLRFEVYGEYADQVAVKSMKGLKEEGMRAMQQAGGQAANIKFKQKGQQMHNPEFQKEMARRSMARPDALQIRSEGGKKGSRARHRNVTVRKEDRLLWLVDAHPFLCTFNFDNGGDLLRELHKARPTALQRVSQLIKGEKKSLYGWSCEKIKRDEGLN